jgi:hypothetical protein
MMNILKQKIFLSFAFAASLFFFSVFLGGEFLHSRIHHHATQQEQGDCPVYQLAAQVLLFAMAAAFVAPVFCSYVVDLTREVYPFNIWCAFQNLRAPPASLL